VDDQPVVEEGDAVSAKVIAVAGSDGRKGGVRPKGARGREGEVRED
jgi:hypothetical protein